MQQPDALLALALLLCGAGGIPMTIYVSYRLSPGSRGALVGHCLWVAGYELLLSGPLARTLANLHWLPADSGLRSLVSAVGFWPQVLGLTLTILGLARLIAARKKETAQ
jgi:hypothetical protein